MLYRSNLECPDLTSQFKLVTQARYYGHDFISDPDFDKNCGYFTHDEVAILYHVAKQVQGKWADLGSRLGWTAAHLIATGCTVEAVDMAYQDPEFLKRMKENMGCQKVTICPYLTSEFFEKRGKANRRYDGFVVDADHGSPAPLLDAKGCLSLSKAGCVVIFHDFYGEPIQEGVRFLIDAGFEHRIYWTPNGVAVCWRGLDGFEPPVHNGDPAISSHRIGMYPGF